MIVDIRERLIYLLSQKTVKIGVVVQIDSFEEKVIHSII